MGKEAGYADPIFEEEKKYLSETLEFLKGELKKEAGILSKQRLQLVEANRNMWEEASHREVNVETAPHLDVLLNLASVAELSDKQVKKYEKMLSSPYFGRFDFKEDGFDGTEKIYIGYFNLMDSKKSKIYVYDWRAPISGIYYRFETGRCFYDSPDGKINGSLSLKRQYVIEKSNLKFYFDSSMAIRDEILIITLSQNSSPKMKNIVETIQKEQDIIIRDLTHNTLIVQGVAGSGKTSVALHRAAYLMYESRVTKLTKNNILIISPNSIFSDYIDSVLPGLGEESVQTTLIDYIFRTLIKGVYIQPKNKMLETMVLEKDDKKRRKRQAIIEYLCSEEFKAVIDNYAIHYERKRHKFHDVVINGCVIFTSQELKQLFLDNKAHITPENRLKRVESRILGYAEPYYQDIYNKLKPVIYDNPKFRFEEEEKLERLVSKYRHNFERKLKAQLGLNIIDIYKDMLLSSVIPEKAKSVLRKTHKMLDNGYLPYEAAASIAYLKLKLFGDSPFSNIRHTIIDEAQDYYPLHYHLFNILLPSSKFTVLGDVNQSLEKNNNGVYKHIEAILGRGSSAFIKLNKSYRSSQEITSFANKIIGKSGTYEAVQRSGEPPNVLVCATEYEMLEKIAATAAADVSSGYQVAVITKSLETAKELYSKIPLGNKYEKQLIGERGNSHIIKGVNIMPIYMAKGLEFDSVIVYGAGIENYHTEFDKNILYTACTRALHKLSVFACETISGFIPNP